MAGVLLTASNTITAIDPVFGLGSEGAEQSCFSESEIFLAEDVFLVYVLLAALILCTRALSLIINQTFMLRVRVDIIGRARINI